jgi:eukaryotic-like serine/threonine-protein kinase
MALGTRMWGAGKIVALALALIATFVLFAAAAARIALRAREVVVPDLAGHTLSGANEALADVDLSLKVHDTKRIDPTIPEDRIVAQDPPAGTSARRGRSVRVWVSAGAIRSTVPRLVGESERTALLRLQQDGLEVASVSEVRSNDHPAGVVVAQEPSPGTRGTRVSLLVNRGDRAAAYLMPDLIGVDGSRAADILRSAGFRVAVVAQHSYPGVPPGFVLRQSPQAGFQIAPGEPISLEVSR